MKFFRLCASDTEPRSQPMHETFTAPARQKSESSSTKRFQWGNLLWCIAAGAICFYASNTRKGGDINADGLTGSPSFIFSDNLTGTVMSAASSGDVGEQITFLGLTSASPRIIYGGTGSTSPMKVIYETESLIVLHLMAGSGSLDSFTIDKKTGLFSRCYSGAFGGMYAGAAVGVCK